MIVHQSQRPVAVATGASAGVGRAPARAFAVRVQAPNAFRLRWSDDGWQTVRDTAASSTALGVAFVDIPIGADQQAPVLFTFMWMQDDGWDGRNYTVAVE